ncbi:MAG: DUF115 domain-containing protein [Candidatus Gastranaerophilales bacterium]|nr:DUF115 domain-containing protein [Candidatus Gastranaerophilales bacterium]
MSLLENNISGIRKYNPKLANKICIHEFSKNVSFELVNTKSADVNLIYNGISVHDEESPQNEAINVLNQINNITDDSITILMGLGLGYLFKRAYLNNKNKIIIFEPNLDILKFTLEVVDFSAELADERIFITNTRTELVKFLESVHSFKASVNLYSLPSSNKLYPQEIETLKNELPAIISHIEGNYVCLFNKSYPWATEGMKNLPDLIDSHNIDSLRNKFKSKPAIVVSSGPSLDKNIEYLKKYRDKIIIFCVANAYKTLIKHNIKPDFINFIEVLDNSAVIKDMDLSNTYQIVQTIANNKVLKLNVKKRFVFYCHNDIVSRWISSITGFSVCDYENKGTVSYSSMYSAYMLGCSPIVLIGQDLAYVNGECYSSDSAFGKAYKCVKDENNGNYKLIIEDTQKFTDYCDPVRKTLSKRELENLAQKIADFPIAFVKGQNGDMIPTNPNYASFIRFFEEFAYDNCDSSLELINSSTGGAEISGYKNMRLNEVLENLPILETTVEKIIEDSLSEYINPAKENLTKIQENLNQLIEDINKYIPMAKDGYNISEMLIKELKRNKKNPDKIGKAVNSLLVYYYKIRENLIDTHIILLNCVFGELLELNPFLENDECISNLEGINRLAILSKNFYEAILTKIIEFKSVSQNSYSQLKS